MKEIQEITIKDKNYPKKLLNISGVPKKLYCLGNISLLEKTIIAIVGSRACSEYGRIVASKFAKELSKQNVCIISGLAVGIDIAAHMEAIKYKGKTIAVLGGGLKDIYPPENREFLLQIIKNGGLAISEYSNEQETKNTNFPKRNRIISGLADGVLLVEAGKRSGSTITARYAKEQKKEVYCIPSNIDSTNGMGTNLLIQNGAKLTISSEDILRNLNIKEDSNYKKIIDEKYNYLINLFEENKAVNINSLSKQTKTNIGKLSEDLLMLELDGVIKQINSNEYIKIGDSNE